MTEHLWLKVWDLAHYLDRLDSPIITDPMISNKFEDLKSKILKDYVALTAPLFMKTCREFQTQQIMIVIKT